MAQFTVDSWRQCALCALVALLASCGNQSSAPAPAANAATQPATATSDTASPPQSATVAELLGGSDSQQPVAGDQSSSGQAPPNNGNEVAAAGAPESSDAEYARVVSVAAVTGPRRVCTNETVTEQRKPNDQHQVAGTVIGAIAGGVIGNQFGGGRGKTLAKLEQIARAVVENYGYRQKDQVWRIPPSIEKQRCRREPKPSCPHRMAPQHEKQQHGYGQEAEQKNR